MEKITVDQGLDVHSSAMRPVLPTAGLDLVQRYAENHVAQRPQLQTPRYRQESVISQPMYGIKSGYHDREEPEPAYRQFVHDPSKSHPSLVSKRGESGGSFNFKTHDGASTNIVLSNYSIISRDNTGGEEARRANLLVNMGSKLIVNQNAAMQNQMGRGIGHGQQQGFQHLQHQMQASKIPQQGQMGVNMGNQGDQPFRPNQQKFQMPGGQSRPQNGILTDASNLTPHGQQKVIELTQKMAVACPDLQKNYYRNIVLTRFVQRAQEYTAQTKDAVRKWFQNRAFQGLSRNAAIARQRQQQGGTPPNTNQAQAQASIQASRRYINPAIINTAGIQAGTSNFSQFNTITSIMNQQKAGILSQEQGQMVVPASSGPARIATPQPIAGNQGEGLPNQPGQSQTPRLPQAQQHLNPAQNSIFQHNKLRNFNNPAAMVYMPSTNDPNTLYRLNDRIRRQSQYSGPQIPSRLRTKWIKPKIKEKRRGEKIAMRKQRTTENMT